MKPTSVHSRRKSIVSRLIRRWDWLLLIVITPIIFFLDARHAWMLLVLPVIIVVEGLAWGDVLPVTPLNPAILLLAIMVGISIFVTPDLGSSLGKISGVLFGIAVYYCAARHTRTKEGLQGSLVLLTLIGLSLAIVGLVGTNWLTVKIIGLNALIERLPVLLKGLPGAESGIHPYELAGALLWIIPVILLAGLALLRAPEWFIRKAVGGRSDFRKYSAWTAFLYAVILVDIGVFVLTQSRGGYLAIFLTGVVLLVIVLKGSARWWAIGSLVVIGIGCFILVWQVGWEKIINQMTSSLPIDVLSFSVLSLDWRIEIWSRAIWAIRDAPLTGLGMNIFRSAVGMIYPTFKFSAANDLAHAHNEILQTAVDLGLPGLVGFIALYAGALRMLTPALRSGGTWQLLAMGLLGGLLAHFLYGITDAVALGAKPGFLFWWLLGMVSGMYSQTSSVKAAIPWKI